MLGVSVSRERVWNGIICHPNGHPALHVGPVLALSFKEEGEMMLWATSHPLLCDTVHDILSLCIKEHDDASVPSVFHGGVGLLHLRRPEATSILTQLLSPSTDATKQEKTVGNGHVISTSFTISNDPQNTIIRIIIKSDNSNASCSG